MKRLLLIFLAFIMISCTTPQKQIILNSSLLSLEVRVLDSQLVSLYEEGGFLSDLTREELNTVEAVKDRYSKLREQWAIYIKDPKELVLNLNDIFDGYGDLYADYLKIRTIVVLHQDEYSESQMAKIDATNLLILKANKRFLAVVEDSKKEEIMMSYINLASQVIKVAVLL